MISKFYPLWPIIILLVLLLFFCFGLFIWDRTSFNRVKRQLSNWKIKIVIGSVILLILADIGYLISLKHGIEEIFETLYNHAWIEIASGILIYFLLEFKIKEFGEVPTEDNERDYDWILGGLSESKKTVKIIDNDFTSFFENDAEKEEEERKKLLKESLIKCLINLERNEKIEILLLHPNTLTAQQRHDDLQFNKSKSKKKDFDLFERINKGLQFLYDFIEHDIKGLVDNRGKLLKSKIIVKLFNTSYSLVFVSWDQFINFSLLRPKVFTDVETFKTLQHTPLAKYFIANFDEIWKDEKTINLEDYKRVEIFDGNNNLVEPNIPWGADSYNHDLPVFISIDFAKKKQFDKAIRNKDGLKTIQVVHDKKRQWAKIIELKDEPAKELKDENDIEVVKNITEFAKLQIEKKSREVSYGPVFYKIEYIHLHRIMLKDDNYVKKHLSERKYCFTPHTKYEVYLGLHLNKLLHVLHKFFADLYEQYENEETKDKAYKRILFHYICTIKENSEIEITYDTKKNEAPNKFPILRIDSENTRLVDYFLRRTIEADVIRINGLKQDIKINEKNQIEIIKGKDDGIRGTYNILVNLNKAMVSKQKEVPDRLEDEHTECMGLYTILHFIGKKNISGGMPSIYFGNDTTSDRDYNFNSALDSIYIKSNKREVIVDSSGSSYNKYEAKKRIKKAIDTKCQNDGAISRDEIGKIIDKNKYGYRNIIAIEIFKSESN
jgi:hypothetical protein